MGSNIHKEGKVMSEEEQTTEQDSVNDDVVRIEIDIKDLLTTPVKVNTGKPVQIIVKNTGLKISK